MQTRSKKAWFEFVASLPCASCGKHPVQVAHYQGLSGHKLGRGMGSKSHDLAVFPACMECHTDIDLNRLSAYTDPQMARIDASEQLFSWIIETIVKGYEAGVLRVG